MLIDKDLRALRGCAAFTDSDTLASVAAPAHSIFRERLLQYMQQRGVKPSQLADGTGMSRPWASAVMKGQRTVPLDTAEKIASFFGVPVTELLQPEDSRQAVPVAGIEGFAAAPLLHTPIAAGRPLLVELDPDNDETLAFHERFIKKFPTVVCLRVGRDQESMQPEIKPGDVVALDRNPERRRKPRGLIYAVNFGPLIGEEGGAVKRVEVVGEQLVISSDNTDKQRYPTIIADVAGKNLLDIIVGEVVWFGRYTGSGKKHR